MARIFKILRQVERVLTGRQPAGRGLTIYPDDVFVVSYPRSGNTWTRFLIGNLLYQNEPVTFSNIESRIPEIYFNSDRQMRRLSKPRMLKSHECFDPRYPRTIYIVRDPRDVAVSFYHHNLKAGNLPDGYPMDDFIPRFISAEFDCKWGSWADNVMSWLCLRQHHQNFLLLTYEEMKKDPVRELARIALFVSDAWSQPIDSGPEKLSRAVELSSPERMRQLEKSEGKQWALTKQTRQDKPFVRSATAGGWKSALSQKSVARIEAEWGDLMTQLGYELTSTTAAGWNRASDRALKTSSRSGLEPAKQAVFVSPPLSGG